MKLACPVFSDNFSLDTRRQDGRRISSWTSVWNSVGTLTYRYLPPASAPLMLMLWVASHSSREQVSSARPIHLGTCVFSSGLRPPWFHFLLGMAVPAQPPTPSFHHPVSSYHGFCSARDDEILLLISVIVFATIGLLNLLLFGRRVSFARLRLWIKCLSVM